MCFFYVFFIPVLAPLLKHAQRKYEFRINSNYQALAITVEYVTQYRVIIDEMTLYLLTQVSYVPFTESALAVVKLTDIDSREEIIRTVRSDSHQGGVGDVAGAISYTRKEILNSKPGDESRRPSCDGYHREVFVITAQKVFGDDEVHEEVRKITGVGSKVHIIVVGQDAISTGNKVIYVKDDNDLEKVSETTKTIIREGIFNRLNNGS